MRIFPVNLLVKNMHQIITLSDVEMKALSVAIQTRLETKPAQMGGE
jgi:hypothetical protein